MPDHDHDLHWLLTSPALFHDLAGIPLMPEADRRHLNGVLGEGEGAGGDATDPHVAAPCPLPAGHQAEALLADALARCPGIDLILAGRQIADGSGTAGEIDLLYDDRRLERRVHLELTVRILLQREPSSAWSAWCGTDPRLTLEAKLARLRDHQLGLGRHPSVPRHAQWPTVSQALILGWLLQPVGWSWPSAMGAAPDHLRGWWLRHGEDVPQSSRAARFHLIPGNGWMRWIALPASTPVLSAGELAQNLRRHFAQGTSAVLVAEVVRAGDGGWREVARGAIVHARWPELP